MSVKYEKSEGKLILTIDNGDLTKIDQVMEKWKFKDYESLLRFSISMFILNQDPFFSIKIDGIRKDVVPVADLLKKDDERNVLEN